MRSAFLLHKLLVFLTRSDTVGSFLIVQIFLPPVEVGK